VIRVNNGASSSAVLEGLAASHQMDVESKSSSPPKAPAPLLRSAFPLPLRRLRPPLIPPAAAREHFEQLPLAAGWTFYFFKAVYGGDYSSSCVRLNAAKVNTIKAHPTHASLTWQRFWEMFNNLPPVDRLRGGSFFAMREDVPPVVLPRVDARLTPQRSEG
jgi:hypothetical protein